MRANWVRAGIARVEKGRGCTGDGKEKKSDEGGWASAAAEAETDEDEVQFEGDKRVRIMAMRLNGEGEGERGVQIEIAAGGSGGNYEDLYENPNEGRDLHIQIVGE